MKNFKFIFGSALLLVIFYFFWGLLTEIFVYFFPNTVINGYGEEVYVMPISQILSGFLIAGTALVLALVFLYKKYYR